jgi:hypothetical protein
MTATNHMLAGAAVALSVQRPLLIVPLAFGSHFVMDALPHFGVDESDGPAQRDSNPLFQYIVLIDIVLTASLLIALPIILRAGVSRWVLSLGMVCAWIPDAVWVYWFMHRFMKQRNHRHNWFTWFHHKLQFERTWGIFAEIIWFGAMGVLLGVLAK